MKGYIVVLRPEGYLMFRSKQRREQPLVYSPKRPGQIWANKSDAAKAVEQTLEWRRARGYSAERDNYTIAMVAPPPAKGTP